MFLLIRNAQFLTFDGDRAWPGAAILVAEARILAIRPGLCPETPPPARCMCGMYVRAHARDGGLRRRLTIQERDGAGMTTSAIGTITPSSNRVVERTLAAILPLFHGLDSCVARIPYHGAGLGQPKDRYDAEPYRQAARQLGHAAVGVVCWNGTRGAGLGLDADRALCAVMAEAAGCPATTAALATATLLDRFGARRLGIVTPGDAAYAEEAAAGLGRPLAGARALGITDNLAAAAVPPGRIVELARDLAAEAKPDVILLWSTNLAGWAAMAPLEAELGIPVIDSAAMGVWACLDALGLDMTPAAHLGRIFQRG